ncbi:MAG: glycoside hydrolase family 25 protein [Chloroflexi bacterium]|nr:glycoside hydrolase family 25 protein [Chloroflexota bacterium]
MTLTNGSIKSAAPAVLLIAALATAPAFAVGPGRLGTQAASQPVTAQPDRVPKARRVQISGIDVSHWQTFVRWREVARDGIDFAIVKATDGTWMKDDWYDRNKLRAERAGLRFTAYHFARPGKQGGSVRSDARLETEWFLRHADLKPRNLAPVLDLEVSGGLGPDALRKWTLTWLRHVERKLGAKPMIYTSPGFWTGRVGNTRAIARGGFDVLWVAHYGPPKPTVPAGRWNGHSWTFWQWTNCGRVQGVKGCVDRNYFRGSDVQDMTIRRLGLATAT